MTYRIYVITSTRMSRDTYTLQQKLEVRRISQPFQVTWFEAILQLQFFPLNGPNLWTVGLSRQGGKSVLHRCSSRAIFPQRLRRQGNDIRKEKCHRRPIIQFSSCIVSPSSYIAVHGLTMFGFAPLSPCVSVRCTYAYAILIQLIRHRLGLLSAQTSHLYNNWE